MSQVKDSQPLAPISLLAAWSPKCQPVSKASACQGLVGASSRLEGVGYEHCGQGHFAPGPVGCSLAAACARAGFHGVVALCPVQGDYTRGQVSYEWATCMLKGAGNPCLPLQIVLVIYAFTQPSF